MHKRWFIVLYFAEAVDYSSAIGYNEYRKTYKRRKKYYAIIGFEHNFG